MTEDSGYLEPDKYEKTYQIPQKEIQDAVDITAATKHFELKLNFGGYNFDYFRNGRNLVMGGKRGHVACFDWITKELKCEFNVQESVHDVQFLHIPSVFAVAQKDWVHIYDDQGIEMHCLKKLYRVQFLDFLPYHFLLVSASDTGYLSWMDVSTGEMVNSFRVPHSDNKILSMCHNPKNGIIHTSHANGTVALWSPNERKPLVQMLANPSAVRGVAVDHMGHYMATAGVDRSLKLWDLRMYRNVKNYKLRSVPGKISLSQKDMLAVTLGNVTEVYKDFTTRDTKEPYLRHKNNSPAVDINFCNYEDVLGVGTEMGFTSLLVPGSGEANFDAFESNPFMTTSQKREMEVKALLEKIQPEFICLDPTELAHVDLKSLDQELQQKQNVPYVKPPKIQLKRNSKRSSVKEAKIKNKLRDEESRKIITDTHSNKKIPKDKKINDSFKSLVFKAKSQKGQLRVECDKRQSKDVFSRFENKI